MGISAFMVATGSKTGDTRQDPSPRSSAPHARPRAEGLEADAMAGSRWTGGSSNGDFPGNKKVTILGSLFLLSGAFRRISDKCRLMG